MIYQVSGVFIEEDNLGAFGESVAKSLIPEGTVRGNLASKELLASLRDIRDVHARLSRSSGTDGKIPESHEWLLDNWYLALREGLSAASELRSGGRLRGLAGGGALLSEAARALVRSGCGECGGRRFEAFLTGFQRGRVMSKKELSLFVPAVKASLITELSLLCGELERSPHSDELGAAMGRVFSSLRLLGNIDLSETLERVDVTEQVLIGDPAGIYPLMDEKTRNHYRLQVSRLARLHGSQEHLIAKKVLKLAEESQGKARHVGYYLFTLPLGKTKKPRRGGAYIAANILLTLFLTLLCGFVTESAPAAALLLLPVSELVKNLIDFLVLRFTEPRHIPRLELRGGVPEEGRTICVISALLSGKEDGDRLARRLEEYRLSNRDAGKNLLFGILADLPESSEPELPGSKEWLASAALAVNRLNEKYGGGFYLLSRSRTFSETDKRYMGWERKRGALIELARLLKDGKSGLECLEGDKASLAGTRYILTLDTDTRLCPGTARELIGAMLHPLNKPVIDGKLRVVTGGTAIIQPRMSVELESAVASDFSRIFAGQGGTDPYGCSSGEIYMDLFSHGIFAGKGIIDARAFIRCLEGRIPENLVLSHDILEGAYLRGQYMGDVELTDYYPAKVLSYYQRMDRWTRGDWQNIPWLFRRGRALCDIDRFKLFDNLRRSLVSPFTFISILLGFLIPSGGLVWAASAAALAAGARLLLTLAECALRPDRDGKVRYHSSVLHGIGGGLVQTFIRLIFLPFEAFVCSRAVITALWRMLVTKRNLLLWQTAAQSEARPDGLFSYYAKMWFVLPAGAAALFLSQAVIGGAAGVVWLLSPLCARVLSLPRRADYRVDKNDFEYLKGCAKEIWRFFEDFTTQEDNYLPPDNWQEQPPVGLAHRTSPTNIGLALLSALCAADLGVAPVARAMDYIENLLLAIEKLPKWNGHLYNWYDTRTTRVLHPRYISAVDSGNLAAALVTLRQGLAEHGRSDLAARAQSLFDEMDFSPLYDKTRRLFHIGRDMERGELTEGWYDLMASEARLTGYVAIAKGDVERRHWRKLSRALVSKDRFRGMASWTGTMFEYLMPELFMPLYRDSLLYESAKFCVYVQRRRAGGKAPWGISESAFFSLDPALGYRYKAHGCAALALKRGMDRELVISPYSTFLALAVEPRAAMRNLRRLEALGARGEYGFWEALDFTASRVRTGSCEPVRCVMAHHLGMSIVSIANHLCDGIITRRFMSEPAMSAHCGLLQEKVPLGGPLLHHRGRELPEKPIRVFGELWRREGTGTDYLAPECCLLSNGAYHLMVSESGITSSKAGDIAIYRAPRRQTGDGSGTALYLSTNGGLYPLTPDQSRQPGMDFSWSFSMDCAEITAHGPGFMAKTLFAVSSREQGELRHIAVSFDDPPPTEAELVFMFEPALAAYTDYINHPSFYKLGQKAYRLKGSLIFQRLNRGRLSRCYLCFACDTEASFTCSRESVPGRSGLSAALSKPSRDDSGWQYDPMACARVKLGPGGRARFALCLGTSENEAYEGAQRILTMGDEEKAGLPRACSSLFGMTADDIDSAMKFVKYLAFPPLNRVVRGEGNPGAKKESLWRFGVSGDFPIVCAQVSSSNDLSASNALIKRHAFLSSCGLSFDLVFLTDDGGDYRRPKASALMDILRKLGRETFAGGRGGVHLADISLDPSPLVSSASVVIGADGKIPESERDVSVYPLFSHLSNAPAQGLPTFCWNDDGSFRFAVNRSLPPRAWGHMLTNGAFGYFATDCGTGHMWYKNAREYRINRWLNDPLATRGTETLELVTGSGRHSLFASPDDEDCLVTFDYGCAVWEKTAGEIKVRTTAFIPAETDARVFIIESAGSKDFEIAWYTDLVLAGDDTDASQIETSFHDGILRAENPRSPFPGASFAAASSAPPSAFTCSRYAWLREKPSGEAGSGFDPCFATVFPGAEILVIACGCCDIHRLRELAQPAFALGCLEDAKRGWRDTVCRFTVQTPNEDLNRMLSGWAQYQAIACRFLGRTSVYQSGGAFGFRDQLQDLVNLIPVMPETARAHIIECCGRQFEEGDVQHWWHPLADAPKGVRTRCSDDLLWLPWALCEYVEKTGDLSVCSETAPYLTSPPLEPHERERYETPEVSGISESVITHAGRAIGRVLERGGGRHGLLLMGSGDWNDGMDRVGEQGLGESVWLTWFFSHTAHRFAALLDMTGDHASADRFRESAESYGRAANDAWDGSWYLRGYYDDGSPLGSHESACCKIDSIAQSFAVLSPQASPEKLGTALESAVSKLFDRENGIIKLFDPPFENSGKNPGYIESYGPGFRENGGQYTHGAIWLSMACLRAGRAEDGWAILRAMLPASRDIESYGAEPYVVPADVYAAPNCLGRAGWSWYTGSAGWFFRVAAEDLLGIKLRSGKLFVEPNLPADWSGYSATWRCPTGREYKIMVKNGKIFIDDKSYDGSGIELSLSKIS